MFGNDFLGSKNPKVKKIYETADIIYLHKVPAYLLTFYVGMYIISRNQVMLKSCNLNIFFHVSYLSFH